HGGSLAPFCRRSRVLRTLHSRVPFNVHAKLCPHEVAAADTRASSVCYFDIRLCFAGNGGSNVRRRDPFGGFCRRVWAWIWGARVYFHQAPSPRGNSVVWTSACNFI